MPLNDFSVRHTIRRYLIILRKIVLRTLLGVVLLFLLIMGLIQIPAIQNYLKNAVIKSLAEKLQTQVKLGYIKINFAGNLVLEDFFVADREQDTLINAEKLKVAVNPAGLLRKSVVISNVTLSGTDFNYVVFDETGRTNIDFIIQSFSSGNIEKKPQEASAWDIQIGKLQLEKSDFVYHNHSDSMVFNLQIGRLIVFVDNNDLDSLRFDVGRISLRNTTARLLSYKLAPANEKTHREPAKKDPAKGPIILLKKLDLSAVTFIQADSLTGAGGMYKIGEAHIEPRTINFAEQYIEVSTLDISKSSIAYTASSVTASSAEAITASPAQNEVKPWRIKLDNAKLQFDAIQLKDLAAGGQLDYLSSIMLSNVRMDFSALFNNVHSWSFNLKSLRLEDMRTSRLISLIANANSEGERLSLSPFIFRIGNSHITGNVQSVAAAKGGGLPDFNASITSSKFNIVDLESYLPPSMYQTLDRIPHQIMLTANVTARNQLLEGEGELRSEQGDIDFTATMDRSSSYFINVLLKDIDAGFFAQNQQFGKVSADLKAKGTGFNPNTMFTDFSLEIPKIDYNRNTYNNIRATGNITNGELAVNVTTSDPIASLTMNVRGNFSRQPDFRVNAHIQNLDLYAMKLVKDTLAISGIIDAQYKARDSVNFDAFTDTFLVDIKLPKRKIRTNTAIRYVVAGDSVNAEMKSNFGDIRYAGNVALQDIGTLLKDYFARHFALAPDTLKTTGKFFRLDVKVNNLAILSDFLNQRIEIPEEAHVSAELKDNRLSSNIDIERFVYNDLEIDGLELEASGRDSSFRIDFKTAAFHNEVFPLKDILVQSNLQRGDLVTRIEVSDRASQKWFNIGFAMQPGNPALNIVIKEPLLLDHREWEVAANNRTSVLNKNIVFENVKLTSGEKRISLLSDARQPEKLAVSFKNMTMALISEILNGDTTFLSGKINGDLMATNLFAKPVPVFDAKLNVSEIVLEERNLGNLNIAANNSQNNDIAQLDVDFGLKNMNLNLNGSYGLKKSEPININLTTKNLDLAVLEPLLKGLISGASGAINASLNVRGLVSNPSIDGQVGFDKVAAFIEPIQAKFSIDQQRIMFRNQQVDFNKFTIKDADGSSMILHGRIALENLKNLQYNLDIKSEEFLVYQGPRNNIPGQDNKVIVTSGISVTGKNNIPQVNATVKIDEGSRFFYKITKQASNLTEEGVIEFEEVENEQEAEAEAPQPSAIENLSLTANITVAENTAVTIITDPLRNLGLNMTASGIFTMNQRPFQSPRLTGRLDISGGDYTMSLSGLRRRFQIADSSFIVWYGNLSEPELNLRAYYEVRTSPAELLGEQSAETSSTLPFMVNMIISGSLSDPKFNFRLSLPREYEGVNNGIVVSKLQEINSNESDLNQKAMALLLFGSFGFDNFSNVLTSNGGGYNVIISNALNQFAAQKLKFVEMHFDLQSYDNYGGTSEDNLRTEMKVAASKKFVDERLNVQLGATFVLQADEQEQQQSGWDWISPEFNIDYKLNKPRTLSVRTFRKSEYRGLVEGKVISTGAGILYQKDFNKLKDLFGKKPDDTDPVAEYQKDIDENM